jgi:hypothetical protein
MQLFQVVSLSPAGKVSVDGFVTRVHASKCPVSYSLEMFVWSAAHGVIVAGEAVLYSGRASGTWCPASVRARAARGASADRLL